MNIALKIARELYIAKKIAMEFNTEEEKKQYQKDHDVRPTTKLEVKDHQDNPKIKDELTNKLKDKFNQDEEYLNLAKDPEKNKDILQKMVDEAADKQVEQDFDYHYTGFIPSRAYERYDQDGGLAWLGNKEKYPKILKQENGIDYRQSGEKNKYTKWDEETLTHERDENGNLIYMSDEEIKKQNLPMYDTDIVAYDGDKPIGLVSNEFGAVGVWVEPKYQKKGISKILLKEHLKQREPGTKIGQMTNAGMNMVRSYLRSEQDRSPVVYDDNHNIVPLSERFNKNITSRKALKIARELTIASKIAMEFNNEEEKKQYQKDHDVRPTTKLEVKENKDNPEIKEELSDKLKTKMMDETYLNLAKDPEKNKKELQKMVDEAANVPDVFDSNNGIGAIPLNGSVNYHGFSIYMTPSTFLSKAAKMNKGESDKYIEQALKSGKKIAPLSLFVDWNNEDKVWQITGHEGRSRSSAFQNIYGDEMMKTHVFPRRLRANDITDEMKNSPFIEENSGNLYKDKDIGHLWKKTNGIKRADSITRDDQNNIIPLSQRFNKKNKDVRY